MFSLLVRGILTCDYLCKILLFRSILMITDTVVNRSYVGQQHNYKKLKTDTFSEY